MLRNLQTFIYRHIFHIANVQRYVISCKRAMHESIASSREQKEFSAKRSSITTAVQCFAKCVYLPVDLL